VTQVSAAPAFASAREALDMVRAGLGYLAAADAAQLPAATQAECLERHDLDAINAQPVDRPVDVGAEQQHATHPGAAEIDLAEGRAGHGQAGELRTLVAWLLHESRHRSIVGGRSGKTRRIVSLAGPAAHRPQLSRLRGLYVAAHQVRRPWPRTAPSTGAGTHGNDIHTTRGMAGIPGTCGDV
jgi:hypothetical protein